MPVRKSQMDPLLSDDLVKHWLLNTTIEFPRSLRHILPIVAGLSLNAKPIPGCDAERYAQALYELFGAGMLLFHSEDPEDDPHSIKGISAILRRFLNYRFEPPQVLLAREQRESDPLGDRLFTPKVYFELT